MEDPYLRPRTPEKADLLREWYLDQKCLKSKEQAVRLQAQVVEDLLSKRLPWPNTYDLLDVVDPALSKKWHPADDPDPPMIRRLCSVCTKGRSGCLNRAQKERQLRRLNRWELRVLACAIDLRRFPRPAAPFPRPAARS